MEHGVVETPNVKVKEPHNQKHTCNFNISVNIFTCYYFVMFQS